MAVGGEFTLRLVDDAGIDSGMRVLDVGCGAGDVSLIAADLVGSSGMILVSALTPGLWEPPAAG